MVGYSVPKNWSRFQFPAWCPSCLFGRVRGKDFMKSYHIHINTGQPFIPCSLKHTDIPFILSSVIQARQCIDIITIRCFLMALKKLQFLFSLFGKVFPLFISPILVYIHTFLNFSSNLSNCILDFAYWILRKFRLRIEKRLSLYWDSLLNLIWLIYRLFSHSDSSLYSKTNHFSFI